MPDMTIPALLQQVILDVTTRREYTVTELYDRLEADHPSLLDDYMTLKRGELVRQMIRLVLADHRQRERTRSVISQRTAEWFESHERPLAVMDTSYLVADDYTRKPLRIMTRNDCRYVADTYRTSANQALLHAAFFDKLAARLKGDDTVADRFTEQQLSDLMKGLTQ